MNEIDKLNATLKRHNDSVRRFRIGVIVFSTAIIIVSIIEIIRNVSN